MVRRSKGFWLFPTSRYTLFEIARSVELNRGRMVHASRGASPHHGRHHEAFLPCTSHISPEEGLIQSLGLCYL